MHRPGQIPGQKANRNQVEKNTECPSQPVMGIAFGTRYVLDWNLGDARPLHAR